MSRRHQLGRRGAPRALQSLREQQLLLAHFAESDEFGWGSRLIADNHITQSGIREFKNLIDYDVFHITDFGLASFSPSLV